MLDKIEFYTSPDGSVNMTSPGEPTRVFDESCREIVTEMIATIRELYPKAYEALAELYVSSKKNVSYFEYRIVHRFIRCNFGEFDTMSHDIDKGRYNIEQVKCPLRGECRNEGIICMPTLQTKLTAREEEIVRLRIQGMSNLEIADELCISPYTVNRHLQIIRSRLKLKSTSQIISYFTDGKS